MEAQLSIDYQGIGIKMQMAQKTVCLVLFIFGTVQSSVLPVEKCTLTDKACMVPAVQKMVPVFTAGMPDLGVEVLDIMKMDDVKFDSSGLKFSLSEGTLKGLKTAVIDNVDWDLKKKVFTIEFHLDASMKGHYTASGQLLVLPVSGDGQLKLKMKNLHCKLFLYYDLVKVGDKEHIKLTKYTREFDVKDNAHFDLTNLFNGNRQLGDTVLTFVNANWKQITAEFGEPLFDAATKKVFKNIAVFFDKLPIGEIANL